MSRKSMMRVLALFLVVNVSFSSFATEQDVINAINNVGSQVTTTVTDSVSSLRQEAQSVVTTATPYAIGAGAGIGAYMVVMFALSITTVALAAVNGCMLRGMQAKTTASNL